MFADFFTQNINNIKVQKFKNREKASLAMVYENYCSIYI
jgi:hypothetical protein